MGLRIVLDVVDLYNVGRAICRCIRIHSVAQLAFSALMLVAHKLIRGVRSNRHGGGCANPAGRRLRFVSRVRCRLGLRLCQRVAVVVLNLSADAVLLGLILLPAAGEGYIAGGHDECAVVSNGDIRSSCRPAGEGVAGDGGGIGYCNRIIHGALCGLGKLLIGSVGDESTGVRIGDVELCFHPNSVEIVVLIALDYHLVDGFAAVRSERPADKFVTILFMVGQFVRRVSSKGGNLCIYHVGAD